MKVRELISLGCDVDVYDDICESLGVCMVGPIKLTKEGEREFSDVLDYDAKLSCDGGLMSAIVKCDDADEKIWRRKLARAKKFFESAAGYCPCDRYSDWFEE